MAQNTDANTEEVSEPKTEESQTVSTEERQIRFIRETILFGIHDERREAMDRIMQIKDEKGKLELNDLLIDILKDELNTEVKIKALTIIGQLNLGRGIDKITAELDDRNEEIRTAAVNALNALNAISTAPRMIELLKDLPRDRDSLYHEALITAIGNFKSKDLVEYAKNNIEDNRTILSLREKYLLYLVRLEDTELANYLLAIAKNENEDVNIRAYAVGGLGRIGNAEHAKEIKAILEDIDALPMNRRHRFYALSIYAITALVRLGDTDATPRLMDALRDNNPSVRLRAVQLLKELKDERTIDILKYKMNHDQNSRVRRIAEEALIEMGTIKKDNANDER